MEPPSKESLRKQKTHQDPKANGSAGNHSSYQFILYVAGYSPKSRSAINNLRQLCEKYLSPNTYTVEIVDLIQEPGRAKLDQILAIPTLVKKVPLPFKKIIGDLSNQEKVLMGLDIYHQSGEVIFSGSLGTI